MLLDLYNKAKTTIDILSEMLMLNVPRFKYLQQQTAR